MSAYAHSIPTPPFSPQTRPTPLLDTDEAQNNDLKGTVNLLDGLIAHYQRERMWVYRTRATLEDAFEATKISSPAVIEPCSPPAEEDMEIDDDYADVSGQGNDADAGSSPRSRWIKRKKSFKLRLEMSSKSKSKSAILGARTRACGPSAGVDSLPPREELLDKFEKMMAARMESCERVNRLVRNAGRAHLHSR